MIDLSRGTYRGRRGDLILALSPGWTVVNDDNAKDRPKVVRNQAVPTPVIFFGSGIKPQHIYREVKAVEIAPTVTHVMRIRSPNAGDALPIPEIR